MLYLLFSAVRSVLVERYHMDSVNFRAVDQNHRDTAPLTLCLGLSFSAGPVQMGADSEEELPTRHVPQLETRLQRRANDVCNPQGKRLD